MVQRAILKLLRLREPNVVRVLPGIEFEMPRAALPKKIDVVQVCGLTTKDPLNQSLLRLVQVGVRRAPRSFPAFRSGKMVVHPCAITEALLIQRFPKSHSECASRRSTLDENVELARMHQLHQYLDGRMVRGLTSFDVSLCRKPLTVDERGGSTTTIHVSSRECATDSHPNVKKRLEKSSCVHRAIGTLGRSPQSCYALVY
jgi:hypothetical protein